MKRITDAQLIELITRRNADFDDPRFIGRQRLQSLLEGQEFLPSNCGKYPPIFDLSSQIEKLIAAGVHELANRGAGLSAEAYRALWPRTVIPPPGTAEHFAMPLLVDLTVSPQALIGVSCREAMALQWYFFRDLHQPPLGPDGSPLERYVAFVGCRPERGNRSRERCLNSLDPDELCLSLLEGLFLAIALPSSDQERRLALLGSWYDNSSGLDDGMSSYLWQKSGGRGFFLGLGYPVTSPEGESYFYENPTRGTTVIPVPQTTPKNPAAWVAEVTFSQAFRYWQRGFGREQGFQFFASYLKSFPAVPEHLQAPDPHFPLLVLVEPRLGTKNACERMGLGFKVFEETMLIPKPYRPDFANPAWVRVHNGWSSELLSTPGCLDHLRPGEQPATALIGLCTYFQHPEKFPSEGIIAQMPGTVRCDLTPSPSSGLLRAADQKVSLVFPDKFSQALPGIMTYRF